MHTRLALLFALLCFSFHASVKSSDSNTEIEKKALSPLKSYVGEWRGVGAVKGDETKGAWTEEQDWAWDFKGGHAALVYAAETGRFFISGRMQPGTTPGEFHFVGVLPGGKTQEEFSGAVNKDNDLVLNAAKAPAAGRPGRITFSLVAKGKRMVAEYQRNVRKDTFAPIAEVGLTLKGSGFGKDVDMRECVVTGGMGKIQVQYKGQTYYVCCGGCRDEFLADPEKEIAAWKKRKEEEKKEK